MADVLTKSERETLKSIYRLSRDGAGAHTGALAEANQNRSNRYRRSVVRSLVGQPPTARLNING
jgi:hypothetical protein